MTSETDTRDREKTLVENFVADKHRPSVAIPETIINIIVARISAPVSFLF